jgi:tetratricopeptide (TPR) repeat protein
MSHHTDDELLAAVRALPAPRPDELTQRRRRVLLDDAIAADARHRRRRLTPVAAALLATVLAGSASAAVAVAVAWQQRDVVVVAPARELEQPEQRVVRPPTPTPTPTPAPRLEATPSVTPDLALDDVNDPSSPSPSPSPKKRQADGVERLLHDVQRDGTRASRSAWMQHAQRDFAGADARLVQAIDDDDDANHRARLRRTRCETWLRHRRTIEAIDVCRSYCQHHPDDAGARPLAFGAGGVAEELGALDDAIDLYTRAIVLSPLQGQSSADALKARARVHARAGHQDDAAADLRLFLRLRPAARFDDDVRTLAERLGL